MTPLADAAATIARDYSADEIRALAARHRALAGELVALAGARDREADARATHSVAPDLDPPPVAVEPEAGAWRVVLATDEDNFVVLLRGATRDDATTIADAARDIIESLCERAVRDTEPLPPLAVGVLASDANTDGIGTDGEPLPCECGYCTAHSDTGADASAPTERPPVASRDVSCIPAGVLEALAWKP